MEYSVMQPMPDYFTDKSSDDGCEVEEPDLPGSKVVKRGEKYRQGGVDTNDPCKSEHVVEGRQENGWLHDYSDWAHAGLPEGIPKATRSKLGNSCEFGQA